jgi:hypothetical protein
MPGDIFGKFLSLRRHRHSLRNQRFRTGEPVTAACFDIHGF